MPTPRNNPEETSVSVKLKGENLEAFTIFKRQMEDANAFKNNDNTMNKILEQWRTKTPAIFRGYKK